MSSIVVAPPRQPARSLARQLTWAFGLLTGVAVGVCAVLVVLIAEVAGDVADVRRDEQTVRRGLALGVGVREQYIHQAHTIIEHRRPQLAQHGDWVQRLRREARALEGSLPPSERRRPAEIAEMSAALDRVFVIDVVPALERGDERAVASAHRTVDLLVARAAIASTGLASALERRMEETHARAVRRTRISFAVASVEVLLLVVLSASAAVRLRRVVQRLLAAERMAAIGQLAAGVAHEVNNPIGIIRGYLRTMLPEARDAEQRAELEILDEEARACQRIVEDLLTFSRASDLRRASVDPAALVRETTKRLEASGELPAGVATLELESAEVPADEARLRQVLANLLRNAAQASPSPGSVHVSGFREPDAYRVVVADRGPGIASEDLPNVFEPFWTKRAGGTGLGLAVCQGIVRAHGGAIEAREREGGGTEIHVTLPVTGSMQAREEESG